MTPSTLNTAHDLEQAFLKWNKFIYSYIYLRVQNRETAEDLAQEVFMNAWRSRETFDPKKASLKSWFFTIAINKIRDHIQKKSNKPTSNLDEIAEKTSDEKINIPEQADQTEKINFVTKKLSNLSSRDREIIILKYQQDLSIKEISEIMDMEKATIRVTLHRALKKLQKFCTES